MKGGTPGRRVGRDRADKVGRRAGLLCDLAVPELRRLRVEGWRVHNNALLRGLGQPEFTADEIVASLLALAPRILPFADRVWQSLDEARLGGQIGRASCRESGCQYE